jgi:hypothetical protein
VRWSYIAKGRAGRQHAPDRELRHQASSRSHLCASNCLRRLAWASDVLFNISRGTLKFVAQPVQTPMAGTVPIHLTTLRLCFCMARFSEAAARAIFRAYRAFDAAARAQAMVVILKNRRFPMPSPKDPGSEQESHKILECSIQYTL